jgi:trans-aconitate 2-methyltransferase
MALTWDPDRYLQFVDLRTRPAADLLGRVASMAPRVVVDLGCGTGNSTRLLRTRWPGAAITGVDNSGNMLESARRAPGEPVPGGPITWEQSSIEDWRPAEPPNVIFSNAALHWVNDHERLFPRLFGMLAPGGVLAVQMPYRRGEQPFIDELRLVARSGPWRERLADLAAPPIRPEAHHYYAWLAPHATAVDVWTTEYLHVLPGEDAVLWWTRSTTQQPFLERLSEPERVAFTAVYRDRLRQAYPSRPDGTTLFPFLRIFIVAVRRP